MNHVMKRIKRPRSVTSGVAVAIAALATLSAAPNALASPPEWLDCPNAVAFERGAAREQNLDAARAAAPTAGGAVSADLAAQAALSMLSYEMYDAYDAGTDPMALLPSGYSPVGIVLGDPGRDTERRDRRRRDTTTFYGFIADELATGRRVVVIRGTLQPAEWIRNVQARQVPYPLGTRRLRAEAWAHRGFLTIFGSLRLDDDRETPLSEALPALVAGRSVAIIGHSLGGARATRGGGAAARRAPADAARLRIVTFASPRVGDQGFADMARTVGRIERVCNLPDLVTMVPPSAWRFDYVHVGETFKISSFDWPALDNDLEAGKQILCWHSIFAYRYMTDPAKTPPDGLADCLRAP